MEHTQAQGIQGHSARRNSKVLLSVAMLLAVILATSTITGCSKSKSKDEKSKKKAATERTIPEPGTPANPIAFAYRITGDPGTNVSVVSEFAGDAVDPTPMTQVWTVSEKPVSMMLPQGVTSGTIRIEITEGTTATIELVKGHANDPADPQSGIKAMEILAKATAEPGAPGEIVLPEEIASVTDDSQPATEQEQPAESKETPESNGS